MDFGDIAAQALELLPVPFLAFESVGDGRPGRDDLCINWANPAAARRFGPDLVGCWLERDAPLGAMVSLVPDATTSRASDRLRVVERAVMRDGRAEYLRYTLLPVDQGAAMMVEDVSTEAEVRAQLRSADHTLARVERWGNLGVWEVDLLTQSVYWSTQVYEILGIETGGLDEFRAIIHPDDLPLVDHVTSRLVQQPGPYHLTHRIVRPDGVRTVDQHMQSVPDDQGRPVRLLGTMIDVTEVRALEQQVRQSQQVRTVGLLAGGLAHDFNNVLLVIRGHADLLLGGTDPDDPAHASLAAISRAGERASVLTRRLMSLGRQEDMRPTRIAPDQLVAGIHDLVGPSLGAEVDLGVEIDDGSTGVEILADRDQLDQTLIDLVLNARDAGAHGIRVRFATTDIPSEIASLSGAADGGTDDLPPGTYGVLEVTDDGCGMDERTRQKIFEPFFTTKDARTGSGLGLANALSFARRSLGGLRVVSEPGVGTTMSLLLPTVAPTGTDAPRRRRRRRTRLLVAAGEGRADQLLAALGQLDHQLVAVPDLEAMAFSLGTEPIDAVVVDQRLVPDDGLPAVLDGVPTLVASDETISDGSLLDAVRALTRHDR